MSFALLIKSPQTVLIDFVSTMTISPSPSKALTLLEVTDVARRERDPDFVDFGGRNRPGRIVFLFTFSDVTHPDRMLQRIVSGDYEKTSVRCSDTNTAEYAPEGCVDVVGMSKK